jgi:DNA modification methylase
MNPRFQIINGDCREALKALADGSVDSVVCDPPYELGFMGKGWDRSGIAYDVSVWSECLRVLKPGGHLLAFGGSRTYHRLACAIEDAGFDIRDQIQWVYASGFPKSLDVSKAIDAAAGAERQIVGNNPYNSRRPNAPVSELCQQAGWPSQISAPTTDAAKQWSGWGTALKPAHEPIVLARKPLIGTVAENVLQHGTGGLNIDRCRIKTNSGESLSGGNDSTGGRRLHSNDGWIRPWNTNESYLAERKLECEARVVKAEELGRWPANVIHDGSDKVLAEFPDAPGQQGDLNSHSKDRLSKGIFGDMKSARDAVARLDSGSAARFFYCAKASQEDRNEGCEGLTVRQQDESRKAGNPGGDNPRNRGLGLRANHHPTVKPTDLMRYLCRLVTPPGGVVLDPFCGSGSTGKAAMLEGLKFIGIELSAEYCELAQRRIEAVTKQGQLFAIA